MDFALGSHSRGSLPAEAAAPLSLFRSLYAVPPLLRTLATLPFPRPATIPDRPTDQTQAYQRQSIGTQACHHFSPPIAPLSSTPKAAPLRRDVSATTPTTSRGDAFTPLPPRPLSLAQRRPLHSLTASSTSSSLAIFSTGSPVFRPRVPLFLVHPLSAPSLCVLTNVGSSAFSGEFPPSLLLASCRFPAIHARQQRVSLLSHPLEPTPSNASPPSLDAFLRERRARGSSDLRISWIKAKSRGVGALRWVTGSDSVRSGDRGRSRAFCFISGG